MRRLQTAAVLVGLSVLIGCGSGPRTHAVEGKVVLVDGDVAQLEGAYVEIEQEGDPQVRGDGLIKAEGRFKVQMLHKGEVIQGLPEGKYRARILLEDEGKKSKGKKVSPVRPQFMDFKTSGLTLTVPPEGEVSLAVSRK